MGRTFQLKLLESAQRTTSTEKISIPSFYKLAVIIFTDCYCGWPGSVHDSRVLRNSDIFDSASNRHDNFFPNNSHLLGDAAYPLKTWIMTPYKDNGHLTEQQKNLELPSFLNQNGD